MTHNQKIIISKLFEGATIAAMGPGQIRLRDAAGNPIMKISGATWYWLKRDILRKKKKLFLVDLRKVRSFHGNSFVKKLYKGKIAIGIKQNTPPIRLKPPVLARILHFFNSSIKTKWLKKQHQFQPLRLVQFLLRRLTRIHPGSTNRR